MIVTGAQGSRLKAQGYPCRPCHWATALPQRQPSAFSLQPSAFSLIELVISMAIMSVGIIGAIRVFPVGLRASQRAEMSSRATIVAQRTIEFLKLKSWDELAEGETTVTEDPFTVTTRIRSPAIGQLVEPTRLKAIEVTVQWTQDTRPRALTFLTYIRRETS